MQFCEIGIASFFIYKGIGLGVPARSVGLARSKEPKAVFSLENTKVFLRFFRQSFLGRVLRISIKEDFFSLYIRDQCPIAKTCPSNYLSTYSFSNRDDVHGQKSFEYGLACTSMESPWPFHSLSLSPTNIPQFRYSAQH
jgi:hypothetical protein